LHSENLRGESGDGKAKSGRNNEAFVSLVRQASKGDHEALIELCKTIAKGTLFRTTRILGNQTDAEDVTQDVMYNVCIHIHELREPKAFYVWLNRIIVNETNRYWMKKTRHGILLNIEDYQEDFGEDDEDLIPQEYAIRESDRKIVMKIIDNLPGQQRKAVLLHYYDGFTLAESAKVMNVSQPRVSRCLKFAQEKIKKELAKQAKGSEEVAYGLAVLPIGPMLTQILHQEAAGFTGINVAWMQDLITNAASLAEGATVVAATATAVTAGAAAGSAGAGGGGATASAVTPAAIIASVAAATVVSIGLIVNVITAPGPPPEPLPVVSEGYAITFSGGDEVSEFINPSKAVAYVYTPERGEMVALTWWITEAGDDTVLYSGYGAVVEEELIEMKDNGETGKFSINFDMMDSFGDNWTLSRKFTLT